jgi:hypothetical protein
VRSRCSSSAKEEKSFGVRIEDLSLNDREVDLNLVEPARVDRRVDEDGVGPFGAEAAEAFWRKPISVTRFSIFRNGRRSRRQLARPCLINRQGCPNRRRSHSCGSKKPSQPWSLLWRGWSPQFEAICRSTVRHSCHAPDCPQFVGIDLKIVHNAFGYMKSQYLAND